MRLGWPWRSARLGSPNPGCPTALESCGLELPGLVEAEAEIRIMRLAGIAGILAAIGLAGEFTFFGLSGFSQVAFNDPGSALSFLREHGTLVRVANSQKEM